MLNRLTRLFALALPASSIGFYKLVYFISLGYAGAIGSMALATVIGARRALSPLALAQNALLGVWASRLAFHLARREADPAYQQRAAEQVPSPGPLWRQSLIWLSVSALYVAMFAPADFASSTSRGGHRTRSVGLVTILLGLLLESIADAQKSRAKRIAPDRYCDTGLYRFVRFPNYLGEMTFWVGNYVAGSPGFDRSPWRWLIASCGLGSILLIMIGSTRRLELSQNARYGDRPDYRNFTRKVPALIPGVPLYSVAGWRLRLG